MSMERGHGLLAATRQLVAAFRVGRRDVQIKCPKRRAPDVPNLVAFAAVDEDQASGAERMTPTVDEGNATSGFHEHPLIRPAMTIVGSTFRVTRRDCHRRRLRATVADDDFESVPKAERRFLHDALYAPLTAYEMKRAGLRRP